jgi:hypothetical protein
MIYEMEYLKSIEDGFDEIDHNEILMKLSAFDQIDKSEDLDDDVLYILDDVDALVDIDLI